MSASRWMNHGWMNCRKQSRRISLLRLRRHLSLSRSPPYLELTRDDLCKLPVARFPGECIVISTLEEERKHSSAIETLFKKKVLGFDTEWSPRRPRRTPSLVQLASEDVCIMWRLCYQNQESLFVGEKFPPRLLRLLTSKKIMKVGHASSHDAYLLLKQYYVNVCSVFDTYPLTRDLCLPMESLRGLAGTMLGMQLTKTQAMTNWENRNLSDLQLQYASTDAWVSLEAYKALVRYAVLQGVKPPLPASNAFKFITDPREKIYLKKKVKRAIMLRAELQSRAFQKGPQRTRSEPSAEPRRPQGILERIKDVINQLLLKIEAAEQSSLSSLDSTKGKLIETPRWPPYHNGNMELGARHARDYTVGDNFAHYRRRPLASVAKGCHVDRDWRASDEKFVAPVLRESGVVKKNENSQSSNDSLTSSTGEKHPRWMIVASSTTMDVTPSPITENRVYESNASDGESAVQRGESLSKKEQSTSEVFCYDYDGEGAEDLRQTTTDNDIETSDRLARNLAPL